MKTNFWSCYIQCCNSLICLLGSLNLLAQWYKFKRTTMYIIECDVSCTTSYVKAWCTLYLHAGEIKHSECPRVPCQSVTIWALWPVIRGHNLLQGSHDTKVVRNGIHIHVKVISWCHILTQTPDWLIIGKVFSPCPFLQVTINTLQQTRGASVLQTLRGNQHPGIFQL